MEGLTYIYIYIYREREREGNVATLMQETNQGATLFKNALFSMVYDHILNDGFRDR